MTVAVSDSEVVRMYVELAMGLQDIAMRSGRNYQAVRRVLKEAGVVLRSTRPNATPWRTNGALGPPRQWFVE